MRTTQDLVEKLLGGDYDGSRDLSGFIASASRIIDRVATCALNKGITLSGAQSGASVTPAGQQDTELELLERWIAAHLYARSDLTYQTKSTGGASAGFQVGPTGEGFESNEYGRAAVAMDYSGCLKNLGAKQRASMNYLPRVTA